MVSRQPVHSRQPVRHQNLRLHHYMRHHFSICLNLLTSFWIKYKCTTENMNRSACYIKFYEKMWIIPILPCSFSPNTVWSNDTSQKCEMHILTFFQSSMNLRIYCKFDLNHPVAYFPFRNLYTLCMHGLTRKQPIKRLVLGDIIFARTIDLWFSVIFHMIEKRTNFSTQWYAGWQKFVLITMFTLAFMIRCTDWREKWIHTLCRWPWIYIYGLTRLGS